MHRVRPRYLHLRGVTMYFKPQRTTGNSRTPGKGKNRQKGYSLVEVMVAILILTIGLLALAKMQTQAVASNNFGNQLTQDTADFNKKIEKFKFTMTEETIREYKAKISKISAKIQSDSDTIYNLNFDVERELRKLLVELENLNQSVKNVQSQVKQKIKPSSP